MTEWCVDANVLIAAVLQEKDTPRAQDFLRRLEQVDTLVGPSILLPECATVLRRKANEGLISQDEARFLLDRILAIPIQIEQARTQFRLALEWELRTNRTRMHDLQYVAVAQLRRATVVTIDGGMLQAASEHGVPVRTLA